MFWTNFRIVKMTMETNEREMDLTTGTYFYYEQVCKTLHLLVWNLLKKVLKNINKQNQLALSI